MLDLFLILLFFCLIEYLTNNGISQMHCGFEMVVLSFLHVQPSHIQQA